MQKKCEDGKINVDVSEPCSKIVISSARPRYLPDTGNCGGTRNLLQLYGLI